MSVGAGARRIVYAQYTNPAGYPSLEHSARMLADAGWQVLFLGTRAPHDEMRFRPHPRIATRELPFQAPGWRQKFHFIFFCLWVASWSVKFRADWLYASDMLSAPATLLAQMVSRARVIYHEHDTPAAPRNAWTRLQFRARRALVRRARACVIPNAARAENFQEDLQARAVCVWNCPAREEILPLEPKAERAEMWVYYHGSIVPARVPLAVVDALARAPKGVNLRLAGYETAGHPQYTQALLERAQRLGVRERIEVIGAVPTRAELFAVCCAGDVGLALMPLQSADANERAMTGASNKPFDYLACGLTLLVSDLSDWRALYVEPGYARACNPHDAASIAGALRWYWEHPAERRAMAEGGHARVVSEWNYETQFAPVWEFLQANDNG